MADHKALLEDGGENRVSVNSDVLDFSSPNLNAAKRVNIDDSVSLT